MQQPIIENVEVRRELEVRFIDIAQAGGGAFGNKRTDPVCVRITQRVRAKGVDMNRHRPGEKAKIRLGKRTRHRRGIPTVIERTIGHRIALGEKRRRLIVNDWNPNFVKLSGDFRKPLVANFHSAGCIVRTIDIGAAPKSALLRRYRIDNHTADRRRGRRVEPANEQHCCILEVTDGAEILKVRIRRRPRNLMRHEGQHR